MEEIILFDERGVGVSNLRLIVDGKSYLMNEISNTHVIWNPRVSDDYRLNLVHTTASTKVLFRSTGAVTIALTSTTGVFIGKSILAMAFIGIVSGALLGQNFLLRAVVLYVAMALTFLIYLGYCSLVFSRSPGATTVLLRSADSTTAIITRDGPFVYAVLLAIKHAMNYNNRPAGDTGETLRKTVRGYSHKNEMGDLVGDRSEATPRGLQTRQKGDASIIGITTLRK